MLLYCLRCKSKQECLNVVEKTTEKNRKLKQGNCPVCNTKCSQFVSNKSNENVENIEKKEKEKKSKKQKNVEVVQQN